MSENEFLDADRFGVPASAGGVAGFGRAYHTLRDLIIRGRLSPGARLIEAELGDKLGLSRTPVREALGRLEQEGFVAPNGPGRRTRLVVTQLSTADFRELCALIGVYEGLALRALDARTAVCREELAERLDSINDELSDAAHEAHRDPDRVFELQTRFHRTFFDAGAGPRLSAEYERVRPHVERYEWAYGSLVEIPLDSSLDEHRFIISAIRVGLAGTAEGAVRAHWEHSAKRICSSVKSLTLVEPPKQGELRAQSAGRG